MSRRGNWQWILSSLGESPGEEEKFIFIRKHWATPSGRTSWETVGQLKKKKGRRKDETPKNNARTPLLGITLYVLRTKNPPGRCTRPILSILNSLEGRKKKILDFSSSPRIEDSDSWSTVERWFFSGGASRGRNWLSRINLQPRRILLFEDALI